MHKLFFKRNPKSISGWVTLKKFDEDGNETILFERLLTRSGVTGFSNTNWVSGKSPTPIGKHWLRTRPDKLNFEPYGTPFFPISTDPKNTTLIIGPNGEKRVNIGMHYDNRFPGSKGCPAVARETKAQKEIAEKMFAYIEGLAETEPFIPFEVFF